MTSSAVANSVSGMVRPSALAVLRLMTSSSFVDCSTGRSAGFSPLYGALEVKRLISRILHFLSFLHTSFFVRLGIPFLRPDPHVLEAGARRGCQGRPSLWPGGTLRRLQAAPRQPRARRHACCGRDDTSEGSSLSGHEEFAPQPCIRWVAVTPTMMHACASAAKLRGGGPILKAGIAAMGESGTPPPRTVIANPSRPSGRERSHNLGQKHQRVSSIRRRDASVLLRARRRRARGATARSAACVPAPRSTSCASTGHPPFAADTIGRAHCLFGTAETATPAGSCRAARAHCPSGPIPCRAVWLRFRRASRSDRHNAPRHADPAWCVTVLPAPACRRSQHRRRSRGPTATPWHADLSRELVSERRAASARSHGFVASRFGGAPDRA